ncbi:ParA family protein [Paenibacillus athensensis]|uniref:AAA domain-containing protein n=1 Tax=Paenibacillus athensensis TaxID=1967502 RepID=A0A4Y8PYL4_9BACL|nr:ParA family protein [Paenibacillus athensensis]MCD1261275.1 ParA family protein [Paenibacillus athensensis]
MHFILFRPRNRKVWIERLRENGWTISIAHEVKKVFVSGEQTVVLDVAAGNWEKFAVLFSYHGKNVYLLMDDPHSVAPETLASYGVSRVITTDEGPEAWNLERKQSHAPELPPCPEEGVPSSSSVLLSLRRKRNDLQHSLQASQASDEALPSQAAIQETREKQDQTVSLWEEEARHKLIETQEERTVRLSKRMTLTVQIPSMLAVYAAKGGVGKTVFLLHLASVLAKCGYKVCLLDLDLMHGTVASTLFLQPNKTIVDLIRRMDNPKASRACFLPTEMGFFIVATPTHQASSLLKLDELPGLLRFLKSEADVVLIDTASHFDAITKLALEQADQLLLLTTNEPVSIHSLGRMKPVLSGLRPSPEIYTVVNRLVNPLGKEKLREVLPWPIVLELPEDRAVALAIRQGECLQAGLFRNPYMVQIQGLVDRWMGEEEVRSFTKRSLVSRLLFERRPTTKREGW